MDLLPDRRRPGHQRLRLPVRGPDALHRVGPAASGETAAWLQNLGFAPSFGLLGLALLLFPDGRLPSRRWRPVLWLALAGIGSFVIGVALRPGPLVEPFTGVSNLFGIPGSLALMDSILGFGFIFTLASVGNAALGIPIRLRRSHGLEREQLKWDYGRRALLATFCIAGPRISEATHAPRAQLDLHGGRGRVGEAKTEAGLDALELTAFPLDELRAHLAPVPMPLRDAHRAPFRSSPPVPAGA